MPKLSWRIAGVLSAASLPATVTAIMITLDRVNLTVLAMVFVLSLPLYVAARGPTRRGAAGPVPPRLNDDRIQATRCAGQRRPVQAER